MATNSDSQIALIGIGQHSAKDYVRLVNPPIKH